MIGVYALELITRRRNDVLIALTYNAPIALLFLVLSAELVLHIVRVGIRAGIRGRAPILLIWFVGLLLLYLRLIAKSTEVSGHMAWLPLLTAQTWLLGFPRWFTAFAAASTLIAIALKFAIFRGPSGVPGILAGIILVMALLVLEWRRRRRMNSFEERATEPGK